MTVTETTSRRSKENSHRISRPVRPISNVATSLTTLTSAVVLPKLLPLRWIRSVETASNGPFLLADGFWKPHTPFNAPKRYWDIYDQATIPVPQHVTPPSGVPGIALTDARYRGTPDSQVLREMHHGHLAGISYLDAQIGKLLSKLDELFLLEKTIIVFWSDHGLHLGEHGLMRKTTAFELNARVPLIIATPTHKKGQRGGALVELLNLYPTLTDLCGLETSQELEGVSLRPLLNQSDARVRDAALSQTPRPNYLRGTLPIAMGYFIRTKRYRYTEWRDFETGAT